MSDLTCTSAAAALRCGELSPLDLVDRCLDRIERYEPRIHAWVMVDAEGARKHAARLGTNPLRGFDRGPRTAHSDRHQGHHRRRGMADARRISAARGTSRRPRCGARRAITPCRSHHPGQDRHLRVRVKLRSRSDAQSWNSNGPPADRVPGQLAALATGMCLAAVGTQTGRIDHEARELLRRGRFQAHARRDSCSTASCP